MDQSEWMIYLYKDSLWVCWLGKATNSYTHFYTMISFNNLLFMSTWVYWILSGLELLKHLNDSTIKMLHINGFQTYSERSHSSLIFKNVWGLLGTIQLAVIIGPMWSPVFRLCKFGVNFEQINDSTDNVYITGF